MPSNKERWYWTIQKFFCN